MLLVAVLALCAQLPMEPPHQSGQSITGAFEGWFANNDGSSTILVGYFNRNQSEALEIPVGANNRIEPGGPDRGQPTYFLPGRQWGMFTIRVPKDFGAARLTWTITANGKTTVIPLNIDPLWLLSPYKDASDNTPPFVSFKAEEPGSQGPPIGVAKTYEATVGSPQHLDVWLADDAMMPLGGSAIATRLPAARATWTKFRGPGEVKFSPAAPMTEKTVRTGMPPQVKFTAKAATSATFSAPGEYWLNVAANDWSGEGGSGFQCCWSTARVRVLVRP